MTKIDQSLRHWIIGDWIFPWFNISLSSLPNRNCSWWRAGKFSLLCGFASAFDRHAKWLAFNFNAYSSNCISDVSSSLLFKFVTNLFKPWEILTNEWELSLFIKLFSSLHSYFPCRQQVVTSNKGQFLVFPSNPTFRFRWIFVNDFVGANNGSDGPAITSLPVLTGQDLYSSRKSETAP